jgi:dTDP-4-dehydrorhamnose reductase
MTGHPHRGPTVLLTGASGLLGTWLLRTVPAHIDLVGLVHRHPVAGIRSVAADLRDAEATRAAIDDVRPGLVVHAAYRTDEASIVDATRHVVAATRSADADLVVVSSDAVFAGDGRPRAERDAPDPVHDYGRWKARAEASAATLAGRSTIVRLPLLVSLDPVDHAVARIQQGAATAVPTVWFDDEVRQPAMAADVAAAIWRIIGLDRHGRTGVWHLPGPESLSRFVIARRVVDALGLAADVIASEPTPAGLRRPRRLQLAGARAVRAIRWAPSPVLRGRVPFGRVDRR